MPAFAPVLRDLELDCEELPVLLSEPFSPLPPLLSPFDPPPFPPLFPPPDPSVTVTTFTTETPGVKTKVVVMVVELFALTKFVTVDQIVVEYVAVARAATVVVTNLVDVEDTVMVLTTDVTVETMLLTWRFATC